MSVYKVTGPTAYRGHQPGEIFEAMLDPLAEVRALRRGNIRLLERSKTALVPGSYTLPVKRNE